MQYPLQCIDLQMMEQDIIILRGNMNNNSHFYVDNLDKMPKVKHWAIIRGSSVHHEEHGVWAPGHGYPAYSESIVTYEAFLKEEEFTQALEKEYNSTYPKDAIGISVDGIYKKHVTIKTEKV